MRSRIASQSAHSCAIIALFIRCVYTYTCVFPETYVLCCLSARVFARACLRARVRARARPCVIVCVCARVRARMCRRPCAIQSLVLSMCACVGAHAPSRHARIDVGAPVRTYTCTTLSADMTCMNAHAFDKEMCIQTGRHGEQGTFTRHGEQDSWTRKLL